MARDPVLDKMIDEALLRMKAGEMPEPIARGLLELSWRKLSDKTKFTLALTGLGKMFGDAHHDVRRAHRSYPERPMTAAQKQRMRDAIKLARTKAAKTLAHNLANELEDFTEQRLGRRLRAADGTQKPLYEFTSADLKSFQSEASAQSAGWGMKAAWCDLAHGALAEAGVKVVKSLPTVKVHDLATKAEDAWRRDGKDDAA